MTVIVSSHRELRSALAQSATLDSSATSASYREFSVGLVPTMGALHDGHLALIEAAAANNHIVVVSVFVNPLQFDKADDLARYPRPISADIAQCERLGVDVVWTPTVADMYPRGGVQVSVKAGEIAQQLEGPNRPGHFDGMLTVVTKLFNSVRCNRAYFGEKDYQQLVLVRQMVADLDQPVEIVGVPTVREADGLARSSRNVFLSSVQRQSALALSRALRAGTSAAGNATAVLSAARAELAGVEGVHVHYLELRDTDLGPAPSAGPARLLIAANVGATRLIDNVEVVLTEPSAG